MEEWKGEGEEWSRGRVSRGGEGEGSEEVKSTMI